MRIISEKKLKQFIKKHPNARASLCTWIKDVKADNWQNTHDIKKRYPSVDFVDNKVIFNIAGNNYRLIVSIAYKIQAVYIKSICTHAEYDKIKIKDL